MAEIVARERQIEAARLAELHEAEAEASRREMAWHAASGAAGAVGEAGAAVVPAVVPPAGGAAGQGRTGKGWLAAKAEKQREHGRGRRPGSGSTGHPRPEAPSRPRCRARG